MEGKGTDFLSCKSNSFVKYLFFGKRYNANVHCRKLGRYQKFKEEMKTTQKFTTQKYFPLPSNGIYPSGSLYDFYCLQNDNPLILVSFLFSNSMNP
jgi:hypothetical protein